MWHVLQVRVLAVRNCRWYLRNPELLLAKLFTYIFMGGFMGVLLLSPAFLNLPCFVLQTWVCCSGTLCCPHLPCSVLRTCVRCCVLSVVLTFHALQFKNAHAIAGG